jgi:hypothetical protein
MKRKCFEYDRIPIICITLDWHKADVERSGQIVNKKEKEYSVRRLVHFTH